MKYLLLNKKSGSEYGYYTTFLRSTDVVDIYENVNVTAIPIKNLIAVSKKIVELAANYSDDPELLLCQYGRISRYNDITWTATCGSLNAEFKAEADKQFEFFTKLQTVILLDGTTLDFPHFWAVLNGIKKGYGDLCGWAGDLVELALTIDNNESTIFPGTGFDDEDWRSDADAYNILKLSSSVIDGMILYYLSNEHKSVEEVELKRTQTFSDGFTSITDRYNGLNNLNKTALSVLINKYGTSLASVIKACERMLTYIDEIKGLN